MPQTQQSKYQPQQGSQALFSTQNHQYGAENEQCAPHHKASVIVEHGSIIGAVLLGDEAHNNPIPLLHIHIEQCAEVIGQRQHFPLVAPREQLNLQLLGTHTAALPLLPVGGSIVLQHRRHLGRYKHQLAGRCGLAAHRAVEPHPRCHQQRQHHHP